MKELELTEGRGTGIPKILKAMKDNGSPAPRFETDKNRSYFAVRLPLHQLAVKKTKLEENTGQVTGQVNKILSFCISARSAIEIREHLALKHAQTFRENHLRPLLAKGLLAMTIPDRPNSRLQKYLTTSQGKAVLEA